MVDGQAADGRAIKTDNQIARSETGLGRVRVRNWSNDLNETILHRNLQAQASELT
jgi:hypothetical protein